MLRMGCALSALIVTLAASTIAPASAQVRDAVYRGTLICDKLPFTEHQMREAISVAISKGGVRYSHVVRLREVAEPMAEEGTGALDGQKISLQGSWTDGNRKYQASYSGVFVRRSAKLRGTQTWTVGGRTITRSCTGSIKRPLRAFLPRERKAP
jgi:hypothetical protein